MGWTGKMESQVESLEWGDKNEHQEGATDNRK